MNKIVECIPNFSEGRDAGKVGAIAAAIRAVPGVVVLDQTMDADHHRSVITFAGEPEAVLEAAFSAARRAVELIDLNEHVGEHPRLGAIDVLPFVPIKDVTMADCVALARRAAERIARELGVPAYLYEQAATRPDRVDLANVRRGEFEGLREEIAVNPDRAPDFGEARVHPTAGAVAVGARTPLIAYNINLQTEDLSVAKKIAQAVRGRDGGLRYVKALGFELRERRQVQVSMNLVNYEATPIFRAFEMVKREAARYGVAIAGSEIIGLVPQAALNACADFYLQIENFSEDLVLEQRLQKALAEAEVEGRPQRDAAAEIAVMSHLPEGGRATIHAGVIAIALGSRICRLILRQRGALPASLRGEHDPDDELRGIMNRLAQVAKDLHRANHEEAESYERLRHTEARPHESEAEQLARTNAIEQAQKSIAAVTLRLAEGALEVLELLDELSAIDGAEGYAEIPAGAQLALAALRAAYYKLLVGLSKISDAEFSDRQRLEVEEMIARGQELADEIESQFLSRQAHGE